MKLRELMRDIGGQDLPEVKPILELNGAHALVKRLVAADEVAAEDISRVLLAEALMLEGLPIADPADFATRMNRLIAG